MQRKNSLYGIMLSCKSSWMKHRELCCQMRMRVRRGKILSLQVLAELSMRRRDKTQSLQAQAWQRMMDEMMMLAALIWTNTILLNIHIRPIYFVFISVIGPCFTRVKLLDKKETSKAF